jgi:hypothetical protein
MRGLNGLPATRVEEEVPEPQFVGPGDLPAVGVLVDGLGSKSMTKVLQREQHYRAGLLLGVAQSPLSQCDAVILPERRHPETLTKEQCWLIWDWVQNGGRLLLTHDAVGYREHPILFPWVCSGGMAHVRRSGVNVVWAPDGEEPLGPITHSYGDHILLQPCIRAPMTTIAVDVDAGKPVVSGAEWGQGRVMACGIAVGAAPDGSDVLPREGELRLLEVMLSWLLS